MKHTWWFFAAIALVGCDPNAKSGDGERGASSERMSTIYESCASSLDCANDLRCLQNECRPTQSSVLGDYYAAVGAKALAAGEINAAVDSYTQAVNQYLADKVEVPLGLYCEQGHALTAAAQDPERAERAAQSLHRCFRAAPVGSRLRARALADLAVLGDAGLDPLLLPLQEDAAQYMTKGPKKPPTDSLTVTATGTAPGSGGSYDGFLQLIQSAEVKASLVPCWEAYWKASKEMELAVTIPFRYRFVRGEYEEDDRYRLTVEGDGSGGDATAVSCVRGAIEPLLDGYSRKAGRGNWKADITVTIK